MRRRNARGGLTIRLSGSLALCLQALMVLAAVIAVEVVRGDSDPTIATERAANAAQTAQQTWVAPKVFTSSQGVVEAFVWIANPGREPVKGRLYWHRNDGTIASSCAVSLARRKSGECWLSPSANFNGWVRLVTTGPVVPGGWFGPLGGDQNPIQFTRMQ